LIATRAAKTLLLLLLLGGPLGCLRRAPLKPYVGNWVLNASPTGATTSTTHPIMTLALVVRQRRLQGSLVRPGHLTEEADGTYHSLSSTVTTFTVVGQRSNHPLLDLTLKDAASHTDHLPIMLIDTEHLVVGGFPGSVPPWRFEKVKTLPPLELFATGPPTP
jgi:hypothetical protein